MFCSYCDIMEINIGSIKQLLAVWTIPLFGYFRFSHGKQPFYIEI